MSLRKFRDPGEQAGFAEQFGGRGYFLGKRLSLHEQRPLELLHSGETVRIIAHEKPYAIENK